MSEPQVHLIFLTEPGRCGKRAWKKMCTPVFTDSRLYHCLKHFPEALIFFSLYFGQKNSASIRGTPRHSAAESRLPDFSGAFHPEDLPVRTGQMFQVSLYMDKRRICEGHLILFDRTEKKWEHIPDREIRIQFFVSENPGILKALMRKTEKYRIRTAL